MNYIYPITTYKPVTGPESFEFMIGFSESESKDILFMSTFDPTFHVVIGVQEGFPKELPTYENQGFNPYRIMVSTRKGLNTLGTEDNIIIEILGLY